MNNAFLFNFIGTNVDGFFKRDIMYGFMYGVIYGFYKVHKKCVICVSDQFMLI